VRDDVPVVVRVAGAVLDAHSDVRPHTEPHSSRNSAIRPCGSECKQWSTIMNEKIKHNDKGKAETAALCDQGIP
jgi:hypothetical protein